MLCTLVRDKNMHTHSHTHTHTHTQDPYINNKTIGKATDNTLILKHTNGCLFNKHLKMSRTMGQKQNVMTGQFHCLEMEFLKN